MEIEILEALPDEPPFFLAMASEGTGNKNDVMQGYAADVTPELARLRAKWECYERIALNQYTALSKKQCIKETPNDLGSSAIPISSYAGAPYDNYKELEKKYHSTIREWVEVCNYNTAQVKYAPVETVALRIPHEPAIPIREPITTGVAAHRDQPSCVHAALLEIIERDAFMRVHLGLTSPSCLITDNGTEEMVQQLNKYQLYCKIYSLPTVIVGVTVLLAVIIDKSGYGPALTAGMSTGYDALGLSKKAILEAWQPRCWLRGAYNKVLLNQESGRICSQLDRGMYWWPLQKLKKVDKLISINQEKNIHDLSKPALSASQLADSLVNRGYSIYQVNLPINDMDNVNVCRMLIPDLYPMYLNEHYNYLSGNANSLFPPIHFFL